ncbi:Lipase 4 [Cladobotryum mycophilum]|uniref:Carboxylic ester hydrolase n=1 Tax=Cladobotryum mycophilum TaxID=491253 RepID=A0ABR0S9H6_9HYPO
MKPITSLFLALAAAPSLSWAAAMPKAPSVNTTTNGPQVDVGYAIYQGYYNDTFGLNVWKSIRYAAPPVGKLRWQAPQPPRSNCTNCITPAVTQPPVCPQTGAYGVPEIYGFNSGPGNEDCLYLNVYAPPGAKDLPVFVWIHGGGNSVFGAVYDPSVLMNTNDNGFITVEIQYRLGAFGYLASPDIKAHGKLNAGLLDQRFALKWVQDHISRFGGDPTRVTVGGESSGAGSVLLQSVAYGGNGSNLFNNIIAASPWEPAVHHYNDSLPTGNYAAFVKLAGCGKGSPSLSQHGSVFDCLVAADSAVLQNASGTVSTTHGSWGTFGFTPVVDGDFIREIPSVLLRKTQVGGKRLLVGTNANEGVPLTNPYVSTQSDFDRFISESFPGLTADDVKSMNQIYQTQNAKPGDNDTRFDTLGDSGPTALTQSSMATGIQQEVFNIAAEVLFHCPAQWFAEAFSTGSRQAWKYQYSLQPAFHGADLSAYWSVGAKLPSAGFRHAFQKIWGSFIIHDSPVISVSDAMAGAGNATVPSDPSCPSHMAWPQYSLRSPTHMNLNTTGGRRA